MDINPEKRAKTGNIFVFVCVCVCVCMRAHVCVCTHKFWLLTKQDIHVPNLGEGAS